MKKLLVQFHAAPDELIHFLMDFREKLPFSTGFMKRNPFEIVLFEKYNAVNFNEMIDIYEMRRVILSNKECLNFSDSFNKFFDVNPDCLVMDIGEFSSGVLLESSLSGFFEDKLALDFANKILAGVKKITKTGVVAINPDNGVEAKIKNHRYTDGAKYLYDNGVHIVPLAGKSYLKLI